VDGSISRRYGGTGLGLTISRQLAELFDGTITVDSTLGVGSRFALIMPFTVAKESDSSHETPLLESTTWNGKPLRILLVEDDLINITFGQALLKKLGHDCTLAKDGRECLAVMEQGIFDLVLMDIHMPVMNGEEALCEIRRKELGTTIHQLVIAMTAYAQRGDKARFLNQGFDGYASKPLDIIELVQEMKRVLGMPDDILQNVKEESYAQAF
jgi:CheY-like chemotaxis protein